ncbi:hypothetical protein PHYBLDRAFT_160265 [Phycomyces blakesleeanus NRRL 1555(-)]|uniref:Uncharacterized protein n=2 Tax=Phycomyces blakesleeanus TaxID=4837 RepID=A0A162TLZ7_PHYB8|nr:hypothetical protein PHYBLDRAFT_160265 [Phycomyces blakesleeanus NRRL 1555(-)]OAD68203.1 hypothetical protein PHYBLDRAFT_160265 [Phycomyces blakesleeanus NRRL 1555(-)]|eukprot:XP_018286243.1 hypothetical protein PHYBLDRAFT_160265 [Phycomyces blakesleeanus NRRL 1555(-)]
MYQASKEWRQHSPVSSVKSSKRSQVIDNDDQSEEWTGYVPSNLDIKGTAGGEEEDEDEIWKGYPGPVLSNESNETSPRRGSSQSESSEPWKGYEATKMESDWEHELTLKVRENDWQGYTLETLDEDELDSSTMLNGEFEKSRQVRGRVEPNLFEKNNFRKGMGTRKNQPNPQNTKRFTP